MRNIDAKWIWAGGEWRSDVQVGWFRRPIRHNGPASKACIALTADTRYRAWWNGEFLGRGPHCGDPGHWSHDTYELKLVPGRNVLAVEVLFQGQYELLKLCALRPALLCWSEEPEANALFASGARWRCLLSRAHSPAPPTSAKILDTCYSALGAFEETDLREIPAGWETIDFDDSSWHPSEELKIHAQFRDQTGVQENLWEIVPSGLPPLAEAPRSWRGLLRHGRARPASASAPTPLWKGAEEGAPLPPPPFDPRTGEMRWLADGPQYLIFDAGEMTTAFLRVEAAGGAGCALEIRYAESLSENLVKGRRDESGGGTVEGCFDRYILRDGDQTIEPFHWRPFRFVKITTDGPCLIRRVTMRRTTYPATISARFESSDPALSAIWDTSLRTAALCAHDTHDDCPSYEQLPYAGDLRLHGPLGLMITGDARLLERSIRMYSWSMRSDGMILTRYPARIPQIIPPFALQWILLVDEFHQLTANRDFVREMWPAIRGILEWFAAREDADDLLIRPFPYWNFTDWSLPQNEGRETNAGNRACLVMFYAGALDAAARLASAAGEPTPPLLDRLARLRSGIRSKLRDARSGLFLDDVGGACTAAHQTILGILHAGLDDHEARRVLRAVIERSDLLQPTIPFLFHLFRAAAKTGMYHAVWPQISRWKDMLALGATTWFEMPEPTRSDCHAWGSWIARDFLTELLGIHPLEPGFRSVLIQPATCGLSSCSGAMPVGGGLVEVSWSLDSTRFRIAIRLPSGCSGGLFRAPNGQDFFLPPGASEFELDPSGFPPPPIPPAAPETPR